MQGQHTSIGDASKTFEDAYERLEGLAEVLYELAEGVQNICTGYARIYWQSPEGVARLEAAS